MFVIKLRSRIVVSSEPLAWGARIGLWRLPSGHRDSKRCRVEEESFVRSSRIDDIRRVVAEM